MEACRVGNVGVVQLALEGGANPFQLDEVRIMCVVCVRLLCRLLVLI